MAEIVLKYTPARPGDHLRGIPARDLTAEEVANIEPFDLRNMTLPGPSGKSMYSPVEPEGDEPKTPAARRAGATHEEKNR